MRVCCLVINDSAKNLKQHGCAMDLIDYNQFPGLSTQERIGVLQAALVGRAFQIQIQGGGFGPSRRDSAGQGGLSYLARSQQDHAWHVLEPVLNVGSKSSADHLYRTPEY